MLSEIAFPIIGHKATLGRLEALLQGGRTPSSLLFSGEAGVGKFRIAQAFASALLCGNKLGDSSFFEDTRSLVRAGNHPDLHYVFLEPDKKDISVASIRELSSKLKLKPYYGMASVAIIDSAHRMNPQAANALLMTLEEPPPDTYLILVTEASHRLLETILSRVQSVCFSPLMTSEVAQVLDLALSGLVSSENQEKLANFSGSSLAHLGLEGEIDKKTQVLLDAEALAKHLDELLQLSDDFSCLLRRFLAGESEEALRECVGLAASVSKLKLWSDVIWQQFRSELRGALAESSFENRGRLCDLMLEVAEGEQLIVERNANPALVWSSLLVKLARLSVFVGTVGSTGTAGGAAADLK